MACGRSPCDKTVRIDPRLQRRTRHAGSPTPLPRPRPRPRALKGRRPRSTPRTGPFDGVTTLSSVETLETAGKGDGNTGPSEVARDPPGVAATPEEVSLSPRGFDLTFGVFDVPSAIILVKIRGTCTRPEPLPRPPLPRPDLGALFSAFSLVSVPSSA